ncbi:hypothetical protein [Cellulomonas rhizosphaerae]|uniref:hypothetical protein n=1 Tax=Cellulomonas rhizosphaerae TaxID=2293719 RepID=UPI0010FD8FE9|nr:hypothetical protein [Cellulomonas rhizosphaerae]
MGDDQRTGNDAVWRTVRRKFTILGVALIVFVGSMLFRGCSGEPEPTAPGGSAAASVTTDG